MLNLEFVRYLQKYFEKIWLKTIPNDIMVEFRFWFVQGLIFFLE